MSKNLSKRNSESEIVTKRIEDSRKEIERLKYEYELLIKKGLNGEVCIETETVIPDVKAKEVISKPIIKKSPKKVNKHFTSKESPIEPSDVSPKKIRHYNVEEAREYMRKQREKRIEHMKQQLKENDNVLEQRKQKLKELHQKSLKILHKNRSRSRDREEISECVSHVDRTEIVEPKIVKKTIVDKKPQIKSHLNDNITIRHPIKQIIEEENLPLAINLNKKEVISNTNSNHTEITINQPDPKLLWAIITIQSHYRGYKQRKLYQKLIKHKREEDNAKRVAKKKELPEWLQTSPQQYPYNFISTVKRKLNFAINSPQPVIKAMSDVAVQSSLETPKTSKEIKEIIERSLHNSSDMMKSNKNWDDMIQKSVLSIKEMEKGLTVLNIKDNKEIYLDLKHIERLKLKSKISDISDSDTSKNIPDISTESIHTETISSKVSSRKPSKASKHKNSITEISNSPHKSSDVLEKVSHKSSKDKVSVKNSLKSITENSNLKHSSNKFSDLTDKSDKCIDHCTKSYTKLIESLHFESKENYSSDFIDKTKSSVGTSNSEQSNLKFNSPGSINSLIQPEDYILSINEEIKSLKLTKSDDKSSKKDVQSVRSRSKSSYSNGSPDIRRDSILCFNKSDYSNKQNSSSFKKSEEEISDLIVMREEMSKSSHVLTELVKPISSQPATTESKSSIKSYHTANSLNSKSPVYSSQVDSFKSSSNEIKTKSSEINSKGSFKTLHSTGPSTSDKLNEKYPSLTSPGLNLHSSSDKENDLKSNNRLISLKPGEKAKVTSTVTSNPIHVKFEAELHLLNDFNDSLRQFMAVEKSLIDLQSKNQKICYETRDTQTSFATKSITDSKLSSKPLTENLNYSRGSDFVKTNSLLNFSNLDESIKSNLHGNSSIRTDLNESIRIDNENTQITQYTSHTHINSSHKKDYSRNVYVGLSLGMFEQLIKDEDARIENLKTILKIREKALLDRTKGQLAWLEIQKKHLIETGKLHEASLVKKKQRGIIIKLQHEKHEMQKLKQMQKAASKERKTVLKEQRNLIKLQLSSQQNTKIKKSKESKSGPLRVYQHIKSHSIQSSGGELYASRSESFQITENDWTEAESLKTDRSINPNDEVAKRTLLMREAALHKRRKAAEELLQWHHKLIEEEKKISELEMATSNIINQVPSVMIENSSPSTDERYSFQGVQLNILWQNMTGIDEKKFNDNETYKLSQVALERFCKDAKKLSSSNKNSSHISIDKSKSSNESILSESKSLDVSENIDVNDGGNIELENGIKRSESRLNEIMQNINNISDELSEFCKLSLNKSDNLTVKSQDEVKTISDESKQSDVNIVSEIKTVDSKEDETDIVENIISSVLYVDDVDKESSIRSIIDDNLVKQVELERKEISEEVLENIKESQNVDEVLNKTDTMSNIEEIESLPEDLPFQSPDKYEEDKFEEAIEEESVKETIDSEISDKITIEDISNKTTTEEENLLTELEHDSSEIVTNHLHIEVKDEVLTNHSHEGEMNTIAEKSLETVAIEDISLIFPSSSKSQAKSSFKINDFSNSHKSIVSEASISSSVQNVIENNTPDVSIVSNSKQMPIDEDTPANSNLNEGISVLESIPDIIKSAEHKLSTESSKVYDKEAKNNHNSSIKIITDEQKSNSTNLDDESLPIDQESKENSIKTESQTSSASLGEDSSFELPSPPVIGVTIEEKRKIVEEIDEEADKSTVNNSETNDSSQTESKDEIVEELSPKSDDSYVDVKKRVSEILADANAKYNKGEKSPRLQDLYVTTYDVNSPNNSPELGSPNESTAFLSPDKDIYGNEAEELLRKQIAIEQEIKQLEQQQKEQLPYIYMREIPNKPPPPYTPPNQAQNAIIPSTVPATSKDIDSITSILSQLLYEAYQDNTLETITMPDNFELPSMDSTGCEFMFDLCKEIAVDHYKQFENVPTVIWLKVNRRRILNLRKPFNEEELNDLLNHTLKQLFGFEKVDIHASMIMKWSQKKHDQVDELLVTEIHAEEAEWTNYDQYEVIVKNDLTNDILNILLNETIDIFENISSKVVEDHTC